MNIKFTSSRLFLLCLAFFSLCLFISIVWADTFISVKIFLLIAFVLYGIFLYRKYISFESQNSIVSIRHIQGHSFEVHTAAGEKYFVNAEKSSVVSRVIMILTFITEDRKKFSAIIFPDAVIQADYKKLQWIFYE